VRQRIPTIADRRAFADSSGYFATLDADDRNHHAAVVVARRLAEERRRLFTTNFVVAESHALILTRLGYAPALRFLAELDRGVAVVVRVSTRDELRAREIIRRYDDKDFSLTDATSFAVMERLRIRDAFTFDRNLEQFGVRILRPNDG
jgi:predicted nucleic acid-binding protein